MNQEQDIVIAEWEKANQEFIKDMEEWRDNYRCGNNCKKWREYKYCDYLIKGRAKYFRRRIEEQVNNLYFLNFGVELNDAKTMRKDKEKDDAHGHNPKGLEALKYNEK